jgi:hypothetical protein
MTTNKAFEWFMSPLERIALADWLARYNGYAIIEHSALKQLAPFGILWDRTRSRLLYDAGRRSAEVQVHSKMYFQAALNHAGKGTLADGDWHAVWALDVASALLSLAGIEHDPTTGIPSRAARFDTIVRVLRPEGEVRLADGFVGEIRG